MNAKVLTLATVLLVACEGEPPKTPASAALPAPAAAETASPAEAPAEGAEARAAAAPATLPSCACNCGCPAAAGNAGVDGGAPSGAAAAAAAAAPPAAPAKRSISGTIVTLPKSAASHAVVYLEDAPIEPTAKMTATITNRMMTFEPFVGVVPVGGKIVFRNDDPFPHNVFSPDNDRFNIGAIPQHAAATHTFKNAGAYTLLCNLHPGMLGYIVVTPSSYFAKADAQGRYVLKDVPPGTYKVSAWGPRQQVVTQSVTVSSADASLDFQLHR